MIFKLHYWFMASGVNALGLLLGVFIETYTDASSTEIGSLYMLMPLISLIFKPMICAMADREQAHQKYMINCLIIASLSYLPFVVIPLLGPGVYEMHPRACWYCLVAFKVVGDIAFSGTGSLGDSLAVNYAKRIGTDFSVYRVWATVSWMCFGLITGQINEVWFLPKYVPAFIILISASLLNALLIWLWPPEYFLMVSQSRAITKDNKMELEDGSHKKKEKKENQFTKSLLPKEVVWAHIKRRLRSLITCSCCADDTANDNHSNNMHHDQVEKHLKSGKDLVDCDKTDDNKSTSDAQIETNNEVDVQAKSKLGDTAIDKRTQFKILINLLRRDPRIMAYLLVFVGSGFATIPVSFLFMQLSEICHTSDRCNFSQLAGLLQCSMAVIEAFLFVYITRIIRRVGRLNTIAFTFLIVSLKYSFYGTIWPQVNPYFALVAEMPHGLMYAIFLTLTVEMAHLFANEVEYILPELIEKGAIDPNANQDKLKLSLSATMQALVSSASDGIGRGVGALIYGLILDSYSFQTLWRSIAVGGSILLCSVVLVNLLDSVFKFELGLDVAHRKQLENIKQAENGQSTKDSNGMAS